MIKGDKIRLVKPMGAFTNVGEICEVTDIAEGGVISFRFGGYHLGCMSYDEYLKYFEKVESPKHREWKDWAEIDLDDFTDIDGISRDIEAEFRTNGKKIQVRTYVGDKCLRAEATCCNGDKFDFDKGLNLAARRLYVNWLSNQVDEMAKSM